MPPRAESILVVDDDAEMLGLTHLMLTRAGYNVFVAGSGKEALNLFQTWPDLEIDLFLVDLIMPGMNGNELADHVRRVRPGIPVLYFSAYPNQEILRPMIARGIPYLAKPFTPVQLSAKIREVLDGGKCGPPTG
jgi:two-component system, cell cycle sensor histidine kinase and response regulator CckA